VRKAIRELIKEVISKEHKRFLGSSHKAISDLGDHPGWFSQKNLFDSTEAVISWCESNIGRKLGSGATRIVFNVAGNSELVFKVARPEKFSEGVASNLKEIKLFNEHGHNKTFFPKVYDSDPQGEWLLIEKVNLLMMQGEDPAIDADTITMRFVPYLQAESEMLADIEGAVYEAIPDHQFKEEAYQVVLDWIQFEGWSSPVWKLFSAFMESGMLGVGFNDMSLERYDAMGYFMYIPGGAAGFFERLFEIMARDPWMRSVYLTSKQMGIDWTDMGPGNMGIDTDGHFKIIDISIFDM